MGAWFKSKSGGVQTLIVLGGVFVLFAMIGTLRRLRRQRFQERARGDRRRSASREEAAKPKPVNQADTGRMSDGEYENYVRVMKDFPRTRWTTSWAASESALRS